MKRRASESGFTLLEILVASMLLAMLITILTMVFNSSSIAWSTGKASVAEMDEVRQRMSAASIVADNAVPRVVLDDPEEWGYLRSPWDKDGQLRRRAIVKQNKWDVADKIWGSMQPHLDIQKGKTGKNQWARNKTRSLWTTLQPGGVSSTGKEKDYVVGVWSLGPDGRPNSGDDISTWPDVQ